jgi:hypothetical protein
MNDSIRAAVYQLILTNPSKNAFFHFFGSYSSETVSRKKATATQTVTGTSFPTVPIKSL